MSLDLHNVTKDYAVGGGSPHRAVDDLSLHFADGRFHTLLGPSGCGKTTLLRLIAGFEHATAGDIVQDGVRINDVPPYRRGFPMVFQSYALFPHMSVLDNVCYGLRVRRTPRNEMLARAGRVLDLLELQSQRDRYPSQLSGGQQQRVALARALVLEPQIILLDEPLSNLDAELRISMRAEIRALQRRLGITAIYVTHDQEEALAVSDRVVVLNHGRIEQQGTPAEVFGRPSTTFVARFMGSPNIFPVHSDGAGGIMLFGRSWPVPASGAGARHVMVRPDAAAFTQGAGIPVVVEEATFLGARVQYRLRADGGEGLLVELPYGGEEPILEAGTRTRMELRPERLHFLDQ